MSDEPIILDLSNATDADIHDFVRQLTKRSLAHAHPNRRTRLPPGECSYCDRDRNDTMMPPHDASRFCESGKHDHCTCDTCY